MHLFRCLLCVIPAILPVAACAADPIATWTSGTGTIAGAPASANAEIAPDAPLVAGAKSPARFTLSAVPGSAIILGPGTTLSLHEEGSHVLILALAQGDVQVDVQGQNAYTAIIVRGEAADVKITGTLFVVERVRHDENYVAMVQGKAHVQLRRQNANGLFDPDAPSIDLIAHQGVNASKETGLGAVETLNNRPQIASADHDAIRTQGLADQVGDGGWSHDDATNLLVAADLSSALPGPGAPGTPGLNPAPTTPDITTPTIDTTTLTMDVVNDILDTSTINTFGSSSGNPSELIRASTVGSPVHPPVLGTYPGPPGP
jgi:hypothetical protein